MKKKRNLKLIKTSDGSNSILVSRENEIYHSRYGAIQESLHVFIENGLKINQSKKIKILEVGMGTGLNVLLTFNHSKNKEISYHALEPFPIDENLFTKLNYERILSTKILEAIHYAPFLKTNILRQNFSFIKYNIEFLKFDYSANFDIIYYDAFSPRYQPEMWHINNFKKSYKILKKGGFLITYCSKGEFKRNLKKVGFYLKHPSGPFGKREITIAFKN